MLKKLFFPAVILALVIFSQATGVAKKQQDSVKDNKGYIEGELLVKFKEGPYSAGAANAHTSIGATVLNTFEFIGGWQHVKLPEDMSSAQGLALYKAMPDCLYAQYNYTYHIFNNPNDPQFPNMYGMARISAPQAWDATTGSNSVIVADIDTGADYNHQDLAANIWHNPGEIPGNGIDDDGNGLVDDYYGYDFYNNDSNPADDNNHGTHTAGTIGAVGNNGIGVVGVNWNVKLMILKTHAANGDSSAATVTAAFNYVTMMKNRGINIRVTSNSWGGAPEAATYDQVLKDAIDAAGNAGVVNVFAAGNDGRDIEPSPSYPASYDSPSIISVASSTSTDSRSSFSNWGLVSVDLAAPGSSIISTTPNNTYSTFSGTSMATPHVSGAVALLAGFNPNLSVASLKATVMNSVDHLSQWSTLVASGGRLNVANALASQTVCNFSLSQSSQNFPAVGGSGSVNLTTNSTACSWGAFSQVNWITVTSASGGTGNTTVTFNVAGNLGGSRTGTIKIGGQTYTVTQDGATSCTYSLSASSQNFSSSGGNGSVNVTTQSSCAWTAVSNVGWVQITSGASGSGSGTVSFSVAANPSSAPRQTTLTIANQNFTVSQDGLSACSFTLNPAARTVSSSAASAQIAVAASSSSCSWTAASNDNWLSITSGASGSGSGTVVFAFTANAASSPRQGSLTIANQSFTVTQVGSGCVTSLDPDGVLVDPSGGGFVLRINAATSCTWSASNLPSWVSLSSPSGTGTRKVTVSVAANGGTSARNADVIFSGQVLAIEQAGSGGVTCTYSLSAGGQNFAAAGGAGGVNVFAPAGCSWAAQSPASWVQITSGSSGSGNGTVSYSVAANPDPTSRSAVLQVAGLSYTVTQDGAQVSCSYGVDPLSASYMATGGTGNVEVTTLASCSWSASTMESWLTITAGSSGSGNGVVSYSVAANASSASRQGVLTVAGQQVVVSQAGAAVGCQYAVSPTGKSLGSGSVQGSFFVQADAGCSWAAQSQASWVSVVGGSSGTGNGQVTYQVQANPNRTSRVGVINVNGQTFTITQAGRSS